MSFSLVTVQYTLFYSVFSFAIILVKIHEPISFPSIPRSTLREMNINNNLNKYHLNSNIWKLILLINFSMGITEVEERKNRHIAELISNHDQSLKEMKQYYNDITNNNLETISELKVRTHWSSNFFLYRKAIFGLF